MFDPFLGLAKCAGHIHHDDDDVRVPHALLHDGDDQEVNYFLLNLSCKDNFLSLSLIVPATF